MVSVAPKLTEIDAVLVMVLPPLAVVLSGSAAIAHDVLPVQDVETAVTASGTLKASERSPLSEVSHSSVSVPPPVAEGVTAAALPLAKMTMVRSPVAAPEIARLPLDVPLPADLFVAAVPSGVVASWPVTFWAPRWPAACDGCVTTTLWVPLVGAVSRQICAASPPEPTALSATLVSAVPLYVTAVGSAVPPNQPDRRTYSGSVVETKDMVVLVEPLASVALVRAPTVTAMGY